jgi:hypothetical protein
MGHCEVRFSCGWLFVQVSPCAPQENASPVRGHAPASTDAESHIGSAKSRKAARIINLLRIAPSEPETLLIQRTINDAAPDLVKALDPDNGKWTPANARWHSVLEFVKVDLRRDAQTTLRISASQISQETAEQYAARADEADMDAVLAFLGSGDGARYMALQSAYW